jgi:tetratricopeptide (TPR) repeat protein
MTSIHRAALTALALALLFDGALHAAGEGRIIATVVDEAGKPVEGAKVVLVRPGTAYKLEKTSDKKGQVMLLILDATQEYQIRVEKAGYVPFEEPVKPKVEDMLRLTIALTAEAPKNDDPNAPKEMPGSEQAIIAYNEGVNLLRTDDLAGAAPKFEEAARLNPELPEPHAALAEVYLELGRHAEALTAADRYLALKAGDPRGLRARYDALKALGDTEKAHAALDALVAADPTADTTAVRLFNEGAELTRAGKFDEAAVWFERVVEIAPADPKFAKAHYVLGLTYAKDEKDEAKKALARERLQTFLQMAPNDPEAETAKQLLDYLK